MKNSPKIHLALPVLNESENLPALIRSLRELDFQHFRIVVCVNNYNYWWDDPEKEALCKDNQKSIAFLRTITDIDIKIIDKSSRDFGWALKKGGVGWARKTIMDDIAVDAYDSDLIVSIDADTWYPKKYLSAIVERFQQKDQIHGLALPYFHRLENDETDRLILRYEIYMRYYLVNMFRIRNPYAFTALGSAMVFPVWAYKKVGGLTPVKSGEDFYFLQKLTKTGKLGIWCETVAYPSSRFSDRVLFGTGPALIKGKNGDWDSYPIYKTDSFDRVGETFDLFRQLYQKEVPIPMEAFLKNQFKTSDLWGLLRKNFKDEANFINACISKVDGLRILQYLRREHSKTSTTNEENLIEWFARYCDENAKFSIKPTHFSFDGNSVDDLNILRNTLYEQEMKTRKRVDVL